MKKLKLILVMATLCLFFNQAKAQTIQITGVINDNQGKTLSGATIQILNQKTKTTSKTDGTFSIASQTPTGTLKISYLGYQSKEIQFNSNSLNRFIITVEPNDTELKQVEINAGYYTVKDKERTGSISRVSAETISKQPINNPLQALQGRVPGVEIVQNTGVPGGGFTVKIRGQNSIANGNAPLYIVDGIPVPSTSLSSNTINVMISPMASPLSSINPNDIESIEILKDADATAIYGSRGANGVILITSKKGKNGDEKLDVNFYQGKGKITRKIELLNTQQYIEMRKEAFKNDNITPQASDYDINGTWDQNRYTDLQKELIGGTANMSNAQLAYSGGNVNTTFMLSGTYYKESTVFPGEHDYQKKSAHLNISHNSSNQKFSLQLNTNYNNEDSTLPQVDLTASIMLPPNIPVLRNQDGGINWENGTFPSNPLIYLYKNYTAKTNTITSNISLDYKFLTGLELTTRAGYTRMQRNELQTSPLSILNPYAGPYTADNRSAYFSDAYNQTINLEPQLNWKTRLGQGKLNFMLGSTIQQNQLHKQTLQGKGAINDGLLANIGASPSITTREVLNATYRYLSAYGRINYSLKEKYYLNITARRDGSSRFGADNLYANFGAVGAAWIFSNEHFISDHLNFLSFGKLRASYGTSGNDQIGDYNFLELWGTTTYAYQGAAGLYPSRISNPSYAWETNRKFETAMELGFLQDKIQLTTAYFRNRSSNQLVRSSLPPSTGFTFIQANLPATVPKQRTGD